MAAFWKSALTAHLREADCKVRDVHPLGNLFLLQL
jgi:hypothetical protein